MLVCQSLGQITSHLKQTPDSFPRPAMLCLSCSQPPLLPRLLTTVPTHSPFSWRVRQPLSCHGLWHWLLAFSSGGGVPLSPWTGSMSSSALVKRDVLREALLTPPEVTCPRSTNLLDLFPNWLLIATRQQLLCIPDSLCIHSRTRTRAPCNQV